MSSVGRAFLTNTEFTAAIQPFEYMRLATFSEREWMARRMNITLFTNLKQNALLINYKYLAGSAFRNLAILIFLQQREAKSLDQELNNHAFSILT